MSPNEYGSASLHKELITAEKRVKIEEVRKLVQPLTSAEPSLFSDVSISRFLTSKNWNTKKASKMLSDTLRWRLKYRPNEISWEDIADEAKGGKIYRAMYTDKLGRPVMILKPGLQDTSSAKGQVRYWIYCIENCILNFKDGKDQMVWLIDFQGWNMGSVSMNVTMETAHILQHHYPEILGLAILYNPPKVFEQFLKIVRPFLEPKTYQKMMFIYSSEKNSLKKMEEFFNLDELESTFGGYNAAKFDYNELQERMKNDEMKFYSSKDTRNFLYTGEKREEFVTHSFKKVESHLELITVLSKEDHGAVSTVSSLPGEKMATPQMEGI
ncbi:uncharacterized protein LOC144714263 [Wolffia australiana]